jgi:hypothetical protein
MLGFSDITTGFAPAVPVLVGAQADVGIGPIATDEAFERRDLHDPCAPSCPRAGQESREVLEKRDVERRSSRLLRDVEHLHRRDAMDLHAYDVLETIQVVDCLGQLDARVREHVFEVHLGIALLQVDGESGRVLAAGHGHNVPCRGILHRVIDVGGDQAHLFPPAT